MRSMKHRKLLNSWCEKNVTFPESTSDLDLMDKHVMMLHKNVCNIASDSLQDRTYRLAEMMRSITIIAELNGISTTEIEAAGHDGLDYLECCDILFEKKWKGQPVIVCDLDDVLCSFRADFANWVNKKYKVSLDAESSEYYFIESLLKNNLQPMMIYDEFVRTRQLLKIKSEPLVALLNSYHQQGAWIYIVTARPDNLISRMDTLRWLRDNGVQFDDVAHAGDKLAHIASTDYYARERVLFAIDDGPNHVMAYATHGMKCCMPEKPYNKNIQFDPNIIRYNNTDELAYTLEVAFDLRARLERSRQRVNIQSDIG